VIYCPTEQMLADFFTKPLQGSLFIKFKRIIMGQEHVRILKNPLPVEERVELREKAVWKREKRVDWKWIPKNKQTD